MSSLTAPFEYRRSITLSFLGQTVVVFLRTFGDELLSLRFCLFPSSGLCIEYSARRSLTTPPFCHHSKNILRSPAHLARARRAAFYFQPFGLGRRTEDFQGNISCIAYSLGFYK